MRVRAVSACIGAALAALVLSASAGAAGPSPASGQAAALKHVAISWVTYAASGNAPKACRLQTEPSVGGTPCAQLPTYFEILYCPAETPDAHGSRWRKPSEEVAKATVKGTTGTVVYRAASKRSKLTARATFAKVAGKWRIASIQSAGQRLAPAGLIFTTGQELRQKLWPPHC